jgi:membrane protein required for colicin V production
MLIDIVFIVLLLIAVMKGYSKGLIIAVFSVAALIIGLAAAIKLSALVASWLKASVHIAAKWLPVIAFLIVFIVAVLLVRLGAKALEKTAQFVWLGWVNKLGGILLYAALYTLIFSILLFYAAKINLLTAETIAASKTYRFINPWGPKAMNGIGSVIPFFKNMFYELENFFSNLSGKIPGR